MRANLSINTVRRIRSLVLQGLGGGLNHLMLGSCVNDGEPPLYLKARIILLTFRHKGNRAQSLDGPLFDRIKVSGIMT